MKVPASIAAGLMTIAFAAPATAFGADDRSGGAEYNAEPAPPAQPIVAGSKARLKKGIAYAPADAPPAVQQMIWAGNDLQDKPYRYGGGHASFKDKAYDCSGTVSYVLGKVGVLESPLDSSSFMKWGERGTGQWVTIYTNRGHAYVIIAGLRLDTSGRGEKGPRWRREKRSSRGFKKRHPLGF